MKTHRTVRIWMVRHPGKHWGDSVSDGASTDHAMQAHGTAGPAHHLPAPGPPTSAPWCLHGFALPVTNSPMPDKI